MTKPMEVNVLFLLKILCREIDQENKHLCPGRLWVLPGYIFAAASGGVSSGAIFEKTTFFLKDSAGSEQSNWRLVVFTTLWMPMQPKQRSPSRSSYFAGRAVGLWSIWSLQFLLSDLD